MYSLFTRGFTSFTRSHFYTPIHFLYTNPLLIQTLLLKHAFAHFTRIYFLYTNSLLIQTLLLKHAVTTYTRIYFLYTHSLFIQAFNFYTRIYFLYTHSHAYSIFLFLHFLCSLKYYSILIFSLFFFYYNNI